MRWVGNTESTWHRRLTTCVWTFTQKSDATMHISVVLCTTVGGWEAETGELLEAHKPVSLAHRAAKKRQPISGGKVRRLTLRIVLRPLHVCSGPGSCALTHKHTEAQHSELSSDLSVCAMVHGPVHSHTNTQKHNTQNRPVTSPCMKWSCTFKHKHTEAQILKVNKRRK